jgi:hypothetical protein
VLARLGDLYARTQDFTPALQNIGQEQENRIRGRFQAQRDPLSLKW